MSWAWLQRWLEQRGRKSRHKETLKLWEIGSTDQRAAILGKSSDLTTSVYVKDYGYIPLVLVNAAYIIEKNLKTPGLFHVKGAASNALPTLQLQPKNTKVKALGVHDTVEALKEFLSSLQETLLPDHVLDALVSVPPADCRAQYVFVLRQFRRHSPFNFGILHFVVNLLNKVSQHAMQNGADVRKLAAILVFDVIRPLKGDTSEQKLYVSDKIQRVPYLITVMEILIVNPDIFKMAGTVTDKEVLDKDPETQEHNNSPRAIAKERNKQETVQRCLDSQSVYSTHTRTETPQHAKITTSDDPAHARVTTQPGYQSTKETSFITPPNCRSTKEISFITRPSCESNKETSLITPSISQRGRETSLITPTSWQSTKETFLITPSSCQVTKENSLIKLSNCQSTKETSIITPPGSQLIRETSLITPPSCQVVREISLKLNQVETSEPNDTEVAAVSTCDVQEVSNSSRLADSLPINNCQHVSGLTDSEFSESREVILKASKVKSSPGKKPMRSFRPKKPANLRRKRIGKCSSRKMCGSELTYEKTPDLPKPQTSVGKSHLHEGISGRSLVTRHADDTNSVMTNSVKLPKVVAAKRPILKKPDGFDDTVNAESSQAFLDEQKTDASNHEDPVVVIPDVTEAENRVSDEETKYTTLTANTETELLKVTHVGVQNCHKRKVQLKMKEKSNSGVIDSSHMNSPRCFSISPMSIKSRNRQIVIEPVSQGSSAVTFSPSTDCLDEDSHRTDSHTRTMDPNPGDGYSSSDVECVVDHTAPAGATANYDLPTRCQALSCSSCCSLRSAAASSVCDDNIRGSQVSVAGCMDCEVCAQNCATDDGQRQGLSTELVRRKTSLACRRKRAMAKNRRSVKKSERYKILMPKDFQQFIIVKVINDSPRAATKRVGMRSCTGATQRPCGSLLLGLSSVGRWVETIFFISLALFIIALVLYHLNHSRPEEEWCGEYDRSGEQWSE